MKKKLKKAFVEAARKEYQDEGRIEIDDNAKVSLERPTSREGYVGAWVWVELPKEAE